MTLSLLVRGLLRRELAPRALGSALVIAAAGGATLAIIAGRMDGARGIALLVVQGDRTLAGLFAIVSVFRVISRLSDDAGNAWPLPLMVVRLASVPAPPLLVSPAVQDTGKLLIYAGVTFGLAIAASERRVARL